jgi:hypothetical protein
MSLNRIVVVGLAAVFTVGMTSFASAGGWGWGGGWGGGWSSGCGGCAAPTAAIVYAQPVAPLPPPVPVTVGWGGGCGCGHQSVVYAAPPIEPTPIAPAPIYVVNQGPTYEGPGITVPYHTWTPVSGYGPTIGYHHHFGYGHHWGYGYRPHLAYHRPFAGYPHRHWPLPMYRHTYPWNK